MGKLPGEGTAISAILRAPDRTIIATNQPGFKK
jgi:hypothetical protein